MDNDAHLTNPAGRLWLLLRDFQGRASKSTQQKPVSVQDALSGYLGIAPGDRVGYYRNVAAILGMPVEIRSAIESLESPVPPKPMLLRPLDLMEVVLPLLAGGRTGAKAVSDQITSGAMSELETCSYVLNHHAPKAHIPKDSLDTIRGLADEIIDALAADETLTAEFREAIRIHAQRISAAVGEYKIFGADRMLDELDALTGVIVRNYGQTDAHRDLPVWSKVKLLTAALITATTLVTAPAEISSAVEFYEQLTAGTSHTTEAPGPHAERSA